MIWLEDINMFPNLDCGDNSCFYKKRHGGMRTNGGCRCSRNHPKDVEMFLRRNYFKAMTQIQQMEMNKDDKDETLSSDGQ